MDNDNRRARLYYLFGDTQQPHGSSWLERLPVGLFAISVGLFALVGAWRRIASTGWPTASVVADFLLWPTTAIWAITLVLYAWKCKRHAQAVLQEFRHPVQGSLQALLPLSIMLAVVQFGHAEQGVWLVIALLALCLDIVIAFRVASTLTMGQMPTNAVTPALYLPIVGGALVGGMTLATLRYSAWGAMLFGTGLAGWALLEARILSRLFEGPMPEGLRPTIGVELAPPIIATLSASVIWPQLPADALLVGLGVAVAPFVAVMARFAWWSKVPFSIGFWSFSFPLAALASVVIEVVHRGNWPMWIGTTVLLIVTTILAFLAVRTVILLCQGRILPPR